MGSKIVAEYKEYLADITVKAMLAVAEKQADGTYKADVDDVKVEKKTGLSLADTSLINGIVIDKEIVHSGMPKRVENAKIALLDASTGKRETRDRRKNQHRKPSPNRSLPKTRRSHAQRHG